MKKHKEVNTINPEQKLLFLGMDYTIIAVEQEFIFHPVVIKHAPVTAEDLKYAFSCMFHIEDYRLILDGITQYEDEIVSDTQNLRTSNLVNKKLKIMDTQEIHDFKVPYNGTVLIGASLATEYKWDGLKTACFSYKNVYELIFEDGVLITTIDHSKEMLRIRKNIELGYRSLTNQHDVRLIKRFINASFVGDYKTFLTKWNRIKYLRDMKKNYPLSENELR